MEVKATAKTLRIPPRKARLVIDLIRGKDVAEAAAILRFTPNAAAVAIGKTLKSAVANAVNNNDMDEEKLYVKACYANATCHVQKDLQVRSTNAPATLLLWLMSGNKEVCSWDRK